MELIMVLPDFYPSSGKPLLLLTTPFYEPFKNLLYEKLNEKWNEDILVLYEYVYFIQDEFINTFFESDQANKFNVNDKGNIEIRYNSSGEFQKIFDLA
jgi:hypothetical protein